MAVATPTASGKSLIYNLAVLNEYLKDNSTTALYLFPLKALAQDQLKEFKNFIKLLPPCINGPTLEVYDGDVSYFKRYRVRQNPPNVLITNPDMLHVGILPNYISWKEFFYEPQIYRSRRGSYIQRGYGFPHGLGV